LNVTRLGLTWVVLLVPATGMGATLPLLTRALATVEPRFGSVLGWLYGWNTTGGVLGIVIAESLLVGAFGIRGTAVTAAALGLSAAAATAILNRRYWRPDPNLAATQRRAGSSSADRTWTFVAFVSGFCLLALEVLWFRLLLLFVMGDSLAFALMLAIVLAGVGAGGLLSALWLQPSCARRDSSSSTTRWACFASVCR
jgi:spermidine synthase